MSWSINATGTKEACIRQVKECSIYGTLQPEEQECFTTAQNHLLDFLSRAQSANDPTSAIAIYRINANGHGAYVSGVSLTTELFMIK